MRSTGAHLRYFRESLLRGDTARHVTPVRLLPVCERFRQLALRYAGLASLLVDELEVVARGQQPHLHFLPDEEALSRLGGELERRLVLRLAHEGVLARL